MPYDTPSQAYGTLSYHLRICFKLPLPSPRLSDRLDREWGALVSAARYARLTCCASEPRPACGFDKQFEADA